ncbi:hypothetical protein F2Q70_00011310 [Brassica cretica]|uniref:Uncharacterized protein n=1 Tax=Brassica cretica TaxID=69181 RepID=A0A8S9M7L0_BRACR|nr:hypothetical protein F2Q70_00011310 [Brassica cretica]
MTLKTLYISPRSKIREGNLANIRRKYLIHPSVRMRSPTEVVRSGWLSGTLMAIQVLGELHGFSTGVHEILYSYYFTPLANKNGFYNLRSSDDAPLVEEPSRGVRCNHPFGYGWNSRYVFVNIQEPVGYPTSWRTVDVSRPVSFAGEVVAKLIMGIPRRFRWVTFLPAKLWASRDGFKAGRVESGTGSKRDGSKAGWVESGMGYRLTCGILKTRNPKSPFLLSSKTEREREREREGDSTFCSSSDSGFRVDDASGLPSAFDLYWLSFFESS